MESSYAAQLQDILLSWDYWQLERDVAEGKGPITELPTIPSTFPTIQAYAAVFQPLLLEEAAAQLLRGQDEGEVALSQRCVVAASERGAGGPGRVRVTLTLPPGVSRAYSENDVVLVSREDPQAEEATDEVHHALGMVAGLEGEQSLRVDFNLSEAAQAGNAGGATRVAAMARLLAETGSAWWALRLANTSTIQREWAAVRGMAHSPLRGVLLSAAPSSAGVAVKEMEVPQPMLQALGESYNPSQLAAVQAGLDGASLSLIQGPPGTGKTKTILGLLSIILNAAPKGAFASRTSTAASAASVGVSVARRKRGATPANAHAVWQAGCPWLMGRPDPRAVIIPREKANPADNFGLSTSLVPVRIGKTAAIKARVLVCAPANSALDEIVLRLITTGLIDKHGAAFTPSVVRVGVSIHHSVQSVALDTLVDLRLDAEGAKPNAASRAERDRLRMAVLEEASIVCTTLAFAGSASFLRLARKFDVVVVDEAAQAVEPSLLVPLANGAPRQVYLVGDPVQLPATVLSSRALAQGYSRSLFSRLQTAGYPVHVLTTQYRMHPDIRAFPSHAFYADALQDGPDMETVAARAWHACPAFAPAVFYDVPGAESTPTGSNSLVNTAEAEVVLSLYRELIHRHPELRGRASVAVISPYKAQVALLRRLFLSALGPELARAVDINTIDGFQGREKEVAILSAVRSSRRGSIGFVADERRMNVGLTRARASLLIVGNAAALTQHKVWGRLVTDYAEKGRLYHVLKPFTDFVGQVAAGQVTPETVETLQARANVAGADGGKHAKRRAMTEPMGIDSLAASLAAEDDPFLYSEGEDDDAPTTKLGSVQQGAWTKRHAHKN